MKVRFKVSSLKFVRFFVESVDSIGSRKSEKLRRLLSKGQTAVKVNEAKGKYYTNSTN